MRRLLFIALLLLPLQALCQTQGGGGPSGGGGGSGTVTSIALVGSGNFFSATPGTPVTASGSLNLDSQLSTQVANCILAGPGSGSAAQPTCRTLVAADLPSTVPSFAAGTQGCPAEYLNGISPASIAAGCVLLDANTFSGSDAAAKLANCQTAAITLGVGCNMGALNGAQTVTSGPMNCGNASSNPVILVFPANSIYTFNGTNLTGQAGMKIWTNCRIYGMGLPGFTTASNTFANTVFAQGTAQLTAVIDTDATQAGGVTGGGKYMTVRGITAVNFSSSPTSSGAVWRIHNWQDATMLADDGGASNTDAFIFDINGVGSGAQGNNNVANCNQDSYTLPTPGFTNGSAVITLASSTPRVDSTFVFSTTGGLPTGFSTATPYYVIPTGYTPGTSFEVSATPRGTAITAGSAGTGTQSAVMPCTALLFENSTSGDSANAALSWTGGSADHPGPYGNNVLITDTEGTNSDSVFINGLYEESSTTSSTAPMNLISGPRMVNLSGLTVNTRLASGSTVFTPIEVTTAYHTDLNVTGITLMPGGGSTWALNNVCVNNLNLPALLLSDAYGNCGGYTGGNSYINNPTVGALAVAQAGTATSGANFGSNAVKWVTSYWNGTAATAGGWNLQVNDATGTNPVETLAFTSLGASSTNPITMPGALTLGAGLTTGAGNTNSFNGRTRFSAPVDGQFLLSNNASTSFTRMQYGGTTSSFAGMCFSGTTQTVCGADGSAVGTLVTPNLTVSTFSTAGIVTNNSSGVLATQTLAAAGVAAAPLTATLAVTGNATALACTTGTVAVTGSTTAMGVIASAAGTSDPDVWVSQAYVSTAGTVTLQICTRITDASAPAITYNIRVIP